ncbi:hypothetical protein, variant 1 [Aphanomyces astaci]|uniref:Major facilitator superfamily (MFS) profile domain-containing protein n=2 Tax=Aphanomyces astaci TaxID=112090 RepID=W4GSD5_APHAT|nr:hypothetical protein, variant 1 [Aphanomyces astaci]ETV82597.1 hypothetical protein, variant 1 [Aphanomyces astaci]|eukprot:XP_009828266.1 hypothetical protein, variant 1 [Aphanomyces astaci]
MERPPAVVVTRMAQTQLIKPASEAAPYGTFVPTLVVDSTVASTKWVMVAILSMLSCLNQAICYTYAPVSHFAEQGWHHTITCTTLITVYFVAYIPFAFIGSWIMDHRGLRFGVLLGAGLQAAGASLRVVGDWIDPSYQLYFLFGGQMLAAVAMPFMVNSPPMLSALWFPPSQRAMATSVAVNCNQLGIALVYILCPLVVTSVTDIPNWTLLIAALSIAAFVVTIFWFKSSAKFLNVDDDVSYDWHQWLNAFHHDGFFLTVFVFAVAETVTNVLSSLLNHILRADVFTKAQKGLIGAAFIVSALVGGQVVSGYIDGTQLHKVALVVCLVVTGVSLVAFHFAASAVFSGQMYVTMACLMVAGLFLGPLQPISLELGVECAHPTTEATVAALQQLCGNFLSAVLVPVLGSIQHAADEVHAQQAAGHEASYWMETFITPEVVLSVLVFIVASVFCGL